MVKQYYLATVSTKPIMKEVQLIEEEIEVLEGVGQDPEAKVVKELICYELDEPSSDRFFLTGANLEERASSSSSSKKISRSLHGNPLRCPG